MRISFFAAALMVAGFCVSAQNLIELKRIPSGLRLKEGKVLFDASSPLNKTVFRQGRNVRMEQSGNRNVLVSGKPAKVISWTVSTLDPANREGRYNYVLGDIRFDNARIRGAVGLAIEYAADRRVSWYHELTIRTRSGKSYGGLLKPFQLEANALVTKYVDLKDKDGNSYAGDGSDLSCMTLGGSAPEFTLYIHRIYTVTGFSGSSRTLEGALRTEPVKFGVYPPGTDVSVFVKGGSGEALDRDELLWEAKDYNDKTVASGSVPFRKKEWNSGVEFSLGSSRFPAGSYQLRLKLKSDGATLPWQGSRPAGFLAFGILPPVEPLPLADPTCSRFGAQGTNYIESGVVSRGDFLNPVYTALGLKWCYQGPKAGFFTRETPFREKTAEEIGRGISYEARNRLAVVTDLHSVPAHLLKLPDYIRPEDVRKDLTKSQAYPLKDPAGYTELLKKIMREKRLARELLRPYQPRNYYQIHWEPDWYWHGSDEEFIRFYQCAREAADAADPGAVILAGNFGVIDIGNKRLKRLFEKGLGKYVNGVATHLYLLGSGDKSPEEKGLFLHCRALRALTDRYLGPDAPIINTEWGAYYAGPARLAEDPLFLRRHLGRFLRGHIIALGEGFNTTWFFYTADYGIFQKGYPDSNGEHGYGMFFNLSKKYSFGAEYIAPKPAAIGIAAAVRLLEGTRSIGRLDFLGKQVYGYAFRRGNENLFVLWAPFGRQKIMLDTAASEIVMYDVMGNARTLRTPGGKLEVALDGIPVYLRGIGDPAVPGLRPAISAVPGDRIAVKPEQNGRFFLEREHSSVPLSGSILPGTLSAGDYRLAERASDGRLLASRRLTVGGIMSFGSVAETSSGFRLECRNRSGHEVPFEAEALYNGKSVWRGKGVCAPSGKTFLTIPWSSLGCDNDSVQVLEFLLKRSGVQDCLVSRQWSYLHMTGKWSRFYSGDRISYNKKLWKNDADLSARYRLSEKNGILSLDLEVRDQTHHAGTLPASPWRSDSVVFALGSGSSGDCEWQKIRIFSLRLTAAGTPEFTEYLGVPPKKIIPTDAVTGTIVRSEKEGMTRYSVRIPLSAAGDPAEIRRAGCFGFGISIQDCDSDRESQLDIHRQLNIGGAPFFMTTMRLPMIYLEK